MSCKLLCIVGLIFFGCCLANARVFYVDEPGSLGPPRRSYGYSMNPENEGSEQASRDLDLSFSAGEPTEYPDDRDIVLPARKIYSYAAPEKPIVEVNREYERPAPYYRIVDVPSRRIIYGDQYPVAEKSRKLVKLNNGPHKGEVVLELRVIANNNNNVA